MASDADDFGVDEATGDFVMAAQGGSDEDVREKARVLLEEAVTASPPVRSDTINLVAKQTEWRKEIVEEWFEEIKADDTRVGVQVTGVTKRVPADTTDPVLYDFDVSVAGREIEVTVPSDNLLTSRVFRQKILERTDRVIDFEDWDARLNDWLATAEIDEQPQEPVGADHSVAQNVVEMIGALVCRANPDRMREMTGRFAHYDTDHDPTAVWVAAEEIDSIAKQTKGDLDLTRTRAILDEWMLQEDAVRQASDGFRVWGFDAARLRDAGHIDAEEAIVERSRDPDADTDDTDTDTDTDQ